MPPSAPSIHSSKENQGKITGDDHGSPIPVYYVDLSKAPEHRYDHIIPDFREQLEDLKQLYDEILENVPIPKFIMHFVSRLLLRRVHDEEEMRELKGICRMSGVSMYLLVAFNVLLDLLMACTSGGARVRCSCKKCYQCQDNDCDLCMYERAPSIRSNHSAQAPPNKRAARTGCAEMMHFRALDWSMDALRKVIVELRYVKEEGGPTIVTNITYLGFVGVLTAVRQVPDFLVYYFANSKQKGSQCFSKLQTL